MYEILVTAAAERDLDDIIAYISGTLFNASAAASLLDKIQACYDVLKETPLMFAVCTDRRFRRLGYRKALFGNYLLVYKVDAALQRVYVLRFFYSGQDYGRKL